jgi:hypothetical protein
MAQAAIKSSRNLHGPGTQSACGADRELACTTNKQGSWGGRQLRFSMSWESAGLAGYHICKQYIVFCIQYIYIYIHMYRILCVSMYLYMCLFNCVYINNIIHVSLSIYICIYTCRYMYVYVYRYVYVYVYIYVECPIFWATSQNPRTPASFPRLILDSLQTKTNVELVFTYHLVM